MKLTRTDFPVIDLKANYGNRYRVRRDECGDPPIRHKWGHFYSHSATELACLIDGRRKFNLIQRQFPDIRVTQEGDQEIIFVSSPTHFAKLVAALKTSRKRQVSEQERKRLAGIGCGTRFKRSCRGYKVPFREKPLDFSPPECIGIGTRQE